MSIILTSDKIYWGYVDYQEKIHIKRYKNDRLIRNAQDSGTTIAIIEPFYAKNIEVAAHMILEKWREDRAFIKKDVN
jgi:hypothetical protein